MSAQYIRTSKTEAILAQIFAASPHSQSTAAHFFFLDSPACFRVGLLCSRHFRVGAGTAERQSRSSAGHNLVGSGAGSHPSRTDVHATKRRSGARYQAPHERRAEDDIVLFFLQFTVLVAFI
ncbi:hypothetical protein PVAP13_4KG285205 [Panicum virgatum]|uniref:Uncharacterized protein n=1 Tax=Panicum virgatum TaxID=38727 RepID=A0A8T0TJG2_PANVG|nr:hypothetical protein PVAP13_4KG285205 [Panicum virgatum]